MNNARTLTQLVIIQDQILQNSQLIEKDRV